MTTLPSKPLEKMTEVEVRAWKAWLLEEGKRPRRFAWGRTPQTLADQVSEYRYEPTLDRVIERSADGKRYVVGVRNAELQRLWELKAGVRSRLA